MSDKAHEDPKVRELLDQKLQTIAKIHDLKAQVGKLNIDLNKAHADFSAVACW